MKFTTQEFKEAARLKRLPAGESSRPQKRARGSDPAPAAPVAARGPAKRGPTERGPAEKKGSAERGPAEKKGPAERGPAEEKGPAEKKAPKPPRAEEGEVTATADAAVVVVDLEDDAPPAAAEVAGAGQAAAAKVAETVQTAAAATPPVTAVPGVERAQPSAGTGQGQPSAAAEPVKKKRPEAGAGSREEARKETGDPPLLPSLLVRPRAVGAPEGVTRLIPRLLTMNDSVDAASRLQRVPTSESAVEVRRMDVGSTVDLLIGSLAQVMRRLLPFYSTFGIVLTLR